MIDMKRRRISATELRVHLGEMLRALEDEEFVIEKGGVPVAVLSRYRPVEAERVRGVLKGDPSKWPDALAAIEEGFTGIDGEALKDEIYRRREGEHMRGISKRGDPTKWPEVFAWLGDNPMAEEDAERMKAEIYADRERSLETARYYIDDIPAPGSPEVEGEILARLRYLHRRPEEREFPRVADEGDTEYGA
jgi:hypothetical protein